MHTFRRLALPLSRPSRMAAAQPSRHMCRVAGPRLSNTPCRPALHPAPLGHCSPAAFGPVTSHSFSTTAAPTAAAEGVRVTIHYVGTLDDGQVFDSSEEDKGGDPLVFDVGEGRMIRGIDNGVRGMTVGESREIRCEPADAYGERDPQGVQTVEVSKLPDDVKAGDQLQTPQGQRVTVTKVSASLSGPSVVAPNAMLVPGQRRDAAWPGRQSMIRRWAAAKVKRWAGEQFILSGSPPPPLPQKKSEGWGLGRGFKGHKLASSI